MVTCLGGPQPNLTAGALSARHLVFEKPVQAIAPNMLDDGLRIAGTSGYSIAGYVREEVYVEVLRRWGD